MFYRLWSMRRCEDLRLTLRGGGRGHLCSSILKPCRERKRQRNSYWGNRWNIYTSDMCKDEGKHTHTQSIFDCRVSLLCSGIVWDNSVWQAVYKTQAQSPDGTQKEEVKRRVIVAGTKIKQRSVRTECLHQATQQMSFTVLSLKGQKVPKQGSLLFFLLTYCLLTVSKAQRELSNKAFLISGCFVWNTLQHVWNVSN